MQHVLRGSKASNYKNTRNVIRNIKYRLAVRAVQTTDLKKKSFSLSSSSPSSSSSSETAPSALLIGQPYTTASTDGLPEDRLNLVASLTSDRIATAKDASILQEEGTKSLALSAQTISTFSTEQEIAAALSSVASMDGASYVFPSHRITNPISDPFCEIQSCSSYQHVI